MKKEQMAQFLEEMNEQLVTRLEHWIITGHGLDADGRKSSKALWNGCVKRTRRQSLSRAGAEAMRT